MSSISDAPGVPMAAAATVVDRPRTAEPRSGRLVEVRDRIWQVSWRAGAIYLASRVVVLLTAGIVAAAGGGSLGSRIYRWDSVWYLRASGLGYPSHLPTGHGHVLANTVAFFPGLPLLIRGLAGLTTMSQFSAGVIISSITGLTATIGVWMLVREYTNERTATRATVLFAFFPGSFVFSMIYSEGLVITGCAFGLLALMRRRWVLAGILGFIATAAAPIALAFELSCLWVAYLAIRKDRDWRSLAAPILAPLGTVAYLLWTWQHTGTLSAFSRTERGGWHSYLSAAYPFRIVGGLIRHPVTSFANQRLVFFCIIAVLVGAWLAIRERQPTPVLIYGIGVGLLAVLTAPVGPRPRIILDAFPLILAFAVRYRDGWRYQVAVAASVALLIGMTAYELASWSVFP